MNKVQQQVEAFHRKYEADIGDFDNPQIRQAEFRKRLIIEECGELVKAINERNIIDSIDGMADLVYVIFGSAVTWGINLQPFIDEVHRTNMNKIHTGQPNTKPIKPEGWEEPNIEKLLLDQIDGSI